MPQDRAPIALYHPRRHGASADKSMIFDLGSAGRWGLAARWRWLTALPCTGISAGVFGGL
jgi:hypothetical protein